MISLRFLLSQQRTGHTPVKLSGASNCRTRDNNVSQSSTSRLPHLQLSQTGSHTKFRIMANRQWEPQYSHRVIVTSRPIENVETQIDGKLRHADRLLAGRQFSTRPRRL